MSAKVRLNGMERESPAWRKVEEVIAERMKAHTAVAVNPTQPEQDRYAAAVRVNELKQLLKLAEPVEEKTAGAGA